MTLNARSQQTLTGIHPDLVKVVLRADALGGGFIVTDGLRSIERQRELVRAGKSKTMRSRHLTGHAVDLCAHHGDGNVSWDHADLMAIADRMKQAAAETGIPIEWGGDWKDFVDEPHFQLPWKEYPAADHAAHAAEPIALEATPVLAPAGDLKKSGTIWGSVGALLSGVALYLEQAFQTLVDAGARLNDLGPAQSLLANVGANAKALSLGLLVMCVGVVISRRVKAKQEGKAG